MECNKDEALRSLDIAQKRFSDQDYAGCKKFVAKAQHLFPALEGAAQIMAAVEVLIIAQGRAPGKEYDWYGILQVEPHADEATIRKQYRKLALTLHPDKNKFAGAEAAFKLVSEAWGVLSDSVKRMRYNEKCGIKVFQNPNFPQAQGFSGSPNLHQGSSSSPASRSYSTATFWTACPYCKMQYQYFRTYENFHLLCQKCKRGYVARDVNINGASPNSFPWGNMFGNFSPQVRPSESVFPKFGASNANVGGSPFANGFVNGNVFAQMSPTGMRAQTAGASMPGAAATPTNAATGTNAAAGASSTAAEFVRQMYQKAKKERVDAQKEEKRKEKEKERLEREREKEERRKEKEAQKKQREDQKRKEILDKLAERLSMKQREMEEREAARRSKSEKLKTKLKKYDSDEEETDEGETVDGSEDEALERVLRKHQEAAGADEASRAEVRRSSRMRRSVSYRFDGSDDDETSPSLKKWKSEDGTENGVNQNIGDGSTVAGDMVGDAVRVDESCKMELGMKFRAYLREYVLPSLNRSKALPKVEIKSQQKAKTKKKGMRKVTPDKSKSTMAEKQGSQDNVKDPEHLGQTPNPVSPEHKKEFSANKERVGREMSPSSPLEEEQNEPRLKDMLVPDPDFHNFDGDRVETMVKVGQIWAIYDDRDGMPRFYCRILRILSTNPFKVRIRWLDSCQSSDDITRWINSGHLLTSGEFKNSFHYETYEQINVFSHVMIADINQNGLIKIYPKKGEVWALYQNWTLEWLQESGNNNVQTYSYDMVEVISDFSEETGIDAIALVKVHGFKTLFEQQAVSSPEDILHYPPNEIFRFSHRVPAHRKTGIEAPNVPEGCWELDPASTPLELIYGQQAQDMQTSEQSSHGGYQN